MVFRLFIMIFLGLCLNNFSIAGSIQFYHIGVEDAKVLAQRENKLIFIDTYATWCKPCKQMDIVFTDPAVGDFFNQNFINVKVNMDDHLGKEVSEEYDVVWLPTLIILDRQGNVKNKIDKLLSASELLQVAREVLQSGAIYAEQTLDSNPFNNTVQILTEEEEKPFIDENNAPILYVYDERSSSGRPHIMFHEAYLHMELMDGKQYQVAKKYLSTQSDWSTDKNVKFIFDFLRNTNSPEFEYLINNRALFEKVISADQIEKAIEIMVYQRLSYGFPRPSLDEALRLYGYINPNSAKSRAYSYFIQRLNVEQNYDQVISMSKEYLSDINPYDTDIMHLLAEVYFEEGLLDAKALSESLRWAEEAQIYDPENQHISFLLAKIYHLKGNKALAKSHCDRAISLARSKGMDTTEIMQLRRTLESL